MDLKSVILALLLELNLILQFLRRKNTNSWDNLKFVSYFQEKKYVLEKFTPLAILLHCRRQWREWQISSLIMILTNTFLEPIWNSTSKWCRFCVVLKYFFGFFLSLTLGVWKFSEIVLMLGTEIFWQITNWQISERCVVFFVL